MKRICIIWLLLFCLILTACGTDITSKRPVEIPDSPTEASDDTQTNLDAEQSSNPDESVNSTTDSDTEKTKPTKPIFETDNVVRITLYINYGDSKGSDVPTEDMAVFLKWLSSFTITEEIMDPIPPGTGFYKVELEYVDGTVVKKSLDTTSIDGIGYYIDGDTTPDCFWEIIEKIPLE